MSYTDRRSYWRERLVRVGFQGDPSLGARMLNHFEFGARWLDRQFQRRGLTFVVPEIVLAAEGETFEANYDGGRVYIELPLPALLADSQDEKFWKYFQYTNPDGSLSYRGTGLQWYELGGVHEERHTIGYQFKDGTEALFPKLVERSPRYYRRPSEYDALHWEIRYARAHGFEAHPHLTEMAKVVRPEYLLAKKFEASRVEQHRERRSWVLGLASRDSMDGDDLTV